MGCGRCARIRASGSRSSAPAAAPALPSVTVCGQQVAGPRAQPPDGSGPVVLFIAPCFEAQGNQSVIEYQTYLYYIQLKASVPSQNMWEPYDEAAEKMILDDFRRLWSTNFLDNLWIEVKDYTFPNGVVGKIVVYNMEERQRVKIVDYVGSKSVETAKIDEKLKDAKAEIRLDTFIDPGLIRKVEGIVRDMLKEKGFQDAEVTHEIKEMPGGPKLVHLTFNLDEGPEVKIKKITFVGNKVVQQFHAEETDEGEQGALVALLHHRQRHLPGSEVRRRRGEGDRVLPRSRLHQGRRRRRRTEGAERLVRQEDALDRAAHSGHRGRALQGGRRSTSRATRW